jgi:tetratricopeptide (TPR) repeat protein
MEFLLSAIVTAAQYAEKLFVPLDLNYFHVFHATRSVSLAFLAAVLTLAAIAAVALHRAIPASVRFAVWWIVLTLAPALNLTGVGQNVFAERYLYLPSVGFAWIAGLGWEWLAARNLRAAWAAGIAILCAGAWQTVSRNVDWRDDFTLLQKTVAQSPDAGILRNNLAGVYVDRNDLDHALEQERVAVQLEPRSAPFHKNLGLLLMARDPRAAVPELEEALRLQPGATDLPPLLNEAKAAAARQ